MPKTYRQKIEELRLKSLQIVEDGLNSDQEYTRFSNAVQFLIFTPNDVLDSEIPDILDAEELEEKQSKNEKN